jgi:predicted nuclease of predicted toxin-antitoxin system
MAYGIANARVISSEDDDFLALAGAGHPHVGLAYCHQHTRSVGQIVRALELIWEVYEPDEMRNRIEFI